MKSASGYVDPIMRPGARPRFISGEIERAGVGKGMFLELKGAGVASFLGSRSVSSSSSSSSVSLSFRFVSCLTLIGDFEEDGDACVI